jgi:hypothetical protein
MTTIKKDAPHAKSASLKSSKQVQISASAVLPAKQASDKSTVISRKKKKTEKVSRSDSQESLVKVQKYEKVSSSSSSTSKKVTTTSTATKKLRVSTTATTKPQITEKSDANYRCQSALQYANKDSITFEHGEIATSMPSSPSHIKRPSSSNGNNIITSEVFTRTVESPKSLEVIYRQPDSAHVQSTHRVKYASDVDASFIETTDSSLSDSIALPSSTSDHDAEMKKKVKTISPQSPKATNIPLDLIEGKSRKADVTTTKIDKDESDVNTSTVNVDSESISPILEFQAVSPQRQKHKFAYEMKDEGKF